MKKYPDIVIQKQPDRYTCYPTCVSILTGISLEKIIEIIGHDGSINDGFSREEIAFSTLSLGWAIVDLSEFNFDSLVNSLNEEEIYYRMILSYKRYKHYHAVAWDGKSKFVIDPMKENLVPISKIKDKISYIEILLPVEERELSFLENKEFKRI